MAMPNIPVPQYPNVPIAPGVPAVNQPPISFNSVVNTATLLTADASQVLQILGVTPGPRWGIFSASTGDPVLLADSVVSVQYAKDYKIPSYPIEGGSFANYNKVEIPFDVRVVFACGGAQSLLSTILNGGAIGTLLMGSSPNQSTRADFLQAVANAAASLSFVNVVTPEAAYTNCNITHYAYRRSNDQGTTLLLVEVWLMEIREPSAAQYVTINGQQQPAQSASVSNPTGSAQQPDGAPQTQTGTVQPTSVSSSTASSNSVGEITVTPATGTPSTTPLSGGTAPLTPVYDQDTMAMGLGTPGFVADKPFYVPSTTGGLTLLQPGQTIPNPDGTPYVPAGP